MSAQLAQINLSTNAVSAIAPEPPARPTAADLHAALTTLEAELARVTTKANAIDAYRQRLTGATSGHLLGSVSKPDLQRAQDDYNEAMEALAQRSVLVQAVAEARRDYEYAQAQEKKAFITNIHKQFDQVRERYVIESKKLLEIFRELHKLNLQSQGMRSVALMDPNAYRLDLPAIRNPNDSPLFSVGEMVRDGGM